MLIGFHNSFTLRPSNNFFAIKTSIKIPPHLERVATLPCEILCTAPCVCLSVTGAQSEADRISRDRLKKLEAILSGDTTIALHLQFLIRTNKADLQILKNTKVSTDFSRSGA